MAIDPTQKTVTEFLTGAMRKTGQYAPGEAISSADLNDALDVFNALLDSKSNNNYIVPNSVQNVIPLIPGKASYTIGTGGDINIQRPMRITAAYSRITTASSTVDFNCDIKPLEYYASIGLKTQPGPWPKMVFYNTSFPLGTMYFWPVPSATADFYFWTEQVLQSVSLNSVLSLPQGYYNYLQFFVAEMLMIDYGLPVPADILRLRREFERDIRSNNTYVGKDMAVDGAIVGSNANDAGWILTGGF